MGNFFQSLQNFNWNLVWQVMLYILQNYFVDILGYLLIFSGGGIILSILYTIILTKFKLLRRKNKYHNWAVKLYIPLIFLVNLFFSFEVGVLVGGYHAIKKDSFHISEQIYQGSTGLLFKDESSKVQSIKELQSIVNDLKEGNQNLKLDLNDLAKRYNTDVSAVDQSKNWLASQVVDKYGDKIHTLSLYAMLSMAPHVNISEQITYEEFDQAVQFLLEMDPNEIEKSLVTKIQSFLLYVLKPQYKSILNGILLIWIAILLIPMLEFLLVKWVKKIKEKKRIQRLEKKYHEN